LVGADCCTNGTAGYCTRGCHMTIAGGCTERETEASSNCGRPKRPAVRCIGAAGNLHVGILAAVILVALKNLERLIRAGHRIHGGAGWLRGATDERDKGCETEKSDSGFTHGTPH